MINKVSKCHICSKFFDSKKKLKDHIDKSHRITNFVTVTCSEAEKITDYILSSSEDVLSVAVIERCGNIIAAKVKESFKKRFRVDDLDRTRYNGSLAVATLSVINEVKDVFEEPEAIITIHKDCKLMLLPMLSYDILIGLVLERSADADDGTIAKKIARVLEYTLKPQL
ncbi:MAG: C2H2-type zinc finger protein [Nitrososphaera sp.]